jgi:hypothetical protein
MSIFGAGHEVVTSTTKPSSPSIGQLIYCTDTDEYLKYVSYGGANRWMQADLKPNRNLCINGSGAVAQRSTGSVALTSSMLYGSIDRFAALSTTAPGTISRITTGLPTAATNNVVFTSGFRFGRNNASALTGTIAVSQALETINSTVAAGKQVTLSYWAKAGANYSSASSLFNANVQTGTGTDQAVNAGGGWTGVAFPLASTPTITTSWAFYSVTGTVAPTATQLEILFSYVPTGTAGADDNVYITGVQLEIGSAPSEFEVEPFETTLRKCQRYYETSAAYGVALGTAWLENSPVHVIPYNTASAALQMPFKVNKRVSPAVTNYSYNGVAGQWSFKDDGADRAGPVTYSRISSTGLGIINNASNNWTTSSVIWLGWIANAEL